MESQQLYCALYCEMHDVCASSLSSFSFGFMIVDGSPPCFFFLNKLGRWRDKQTLVLIGKVLMNYRFDQKWLILNCSNNILAKNYLNVQKGDRVGLMNRCFLSLFIICT